jgi:glycosyltransferase involved in cell wall biosynthesis
MSAAAPLVSIGMPAFNCGETLAVAIRSILNQTYKNWELLVMEDGSTDRTLEVARSFSDPRISVLFDYSHKGLVPRLNQAVATSHGEYFARMDADDVAYPERLERQVEYLQQHPEVDLLGCPMLMFKDDGVAFGCRPTPKNHEEICGQPSSGFRIAHATLMGRVSWFRVHLYDPGAPRAEDYDLFLRSYATSRFACLSEILYGCREDRLLLRKILVGRYGVVKAAAREFASRRKYFTAAGALLKQFAKAQVDVFAVLTGLEYRVLAHRARPLHADDLQRWTEVWSELQHETEGRAGRGKLLREPGRWSGGPLRTAVGRSRPISGGHL